MACAWSRTWKGGWAIAQSPILTSTITFARLAKRGYESMVEYYLKICPRFNEPLIRDLPHMRDTVVYSAVFIL